VSDIDIIVQELWYSLNVSFHDCLGRGTMGMSKGGYDPDGEKVDERVDEHVGGERDGWHRVVLIPSASVTRILPDTSGVTIISEDILQPPATCPLDQQYFRYT